MMYLFYLSFYDSVLSLAPIFLQDEFPELLSPTFNTTVYQCIWVWSHTKSTLNWDIIAENFIIKFILVVFFSSFSLLYCSFLLFLPLKQYSILKHSFSLKVKAKPVKDYPQEVFHIMNKFISTIPFFNTYPSSWRVERSCVPLLRWHHPGNSLTCKKSRSWWMDGNGAN